MGVSIFLPTFVTVLIGCEVVYLIVVLMSSFLITYGVEHLSMLLIGRLYYLQYFSLRLGVYLTDIFVLHEGSSAIELKDVTHFLKFRTIVPTSLILP